MASLRRCHSAWNSTSPKFGVDMMITSLLSYQASMLLERGNACSSSSSVCMEDACMEEGSYWKLRAARHGVPRCEKCQTWCGCHTGGPVCSAIGSPAGMVREGKCQYHPLCSLFCLVLGVGCESTLFSSPTINNCFHNLLYYILQPHKGSCQPVACKLNLKWLFLWFSQCEQQSR